MTPSNQAADLDAYKPQPLGFEPHTNAPIRIGVMGSAGGDMSDEAVDLCGQLGMSIANHGCCLLTGACPGLPHLAVIGAKQRGGHIIGISPASNLREHVEFFESPYAEYDVLIFTGLGLMGRELINIRSSDIVIVVGGRCGTLGEFAIAFEEGKLIGVLQGTGGITEALAVLEPTLDKKTGAEVVYGTSPDGLVTALLERYQSPGYHCPCAPRGLHSARSEGSNIECACACSEPARAS